MFELIGTQELLQFRFEAFTASGTEAGFIRIFALATGTVHNGEIPAVNWTKSLDWPKNKWVTKLSSLEGLVHAVSGESKPGQANNS